MSLYIAAPARGPNLRWSDSRLTLRAAGAALVEMTALYGLVPAFGFVVLGALFRLGVFGGTEVLFYRGLMLIGLAFALTLAAGILAIRAWSRGGVRIRDAVSAAVLSLALNLSFFIVLPVTVDRSISVFILGEMTAHGEQTYSADDISRLFAKVYVGDYRQIDRRMHEQLLSGNIEQTGHGYRISPRGARFIALSKAVAWMFDGDPRLVSPPAAR
jgi:hypothetical protein